jgi:CMP-N,N'-diacetyllegionaminic acid synthase|nr:acylneuraminate cytidylyltransferase family protein [uncultured Acetatifactor sp.]
MYKNKKILAIIPARGGSKGIPHKNIIDLCGRPLISYTIEAAIRSKYIDYTIVSTDDEEIAKVSKEYGAEIPFLRPAELATDTSKTIESVIYTIRTVQERGKFFDTIVLLQPTQPLRTSEDIDGAIEKYDESGNVPLASVSEVDDHPILIRAIEKEQLIPLLNTPSTCRRQDMPAFYRVNGCIYINEISEVNEHTSFNDNILPYIMDKRHSVDIDEEQDLVIAEYYLNLKKE